MEDSVLFVWVFCGVKGPFPGAVFLSFQKAERWIFMHKLTGVLTKYPTDIGAFDWAVENKLFTRTERASAEFIASFSSASFEHHQYELGARG
jgi:hypothetical protein